MRRVYKYPIPVLGQPITLQIARGYKVVSFGHQGDPQTVFMWAEVNPEEEELVDHTFHVFGTGHDITDDNLEFVATVNVWPVGLVWHVYQEKNDAVVTGTQ